MISKSQGDHWGRIYFHSVLTVLPMVAKDSIQNKILTLEPYFSFVYGYSF
jgi:hypothetical protein